VDEGDLEQTAALLEAFVGTPPVARGMNV
jgi:hypothetical protein